MTCRESSWFCSVADGARAPVPPTVHFVQQVHPLGSCPIEAEDTPEWMALPPGRLVTCGGHVAGGNEARTVPQFQPQRPQVRWQETFVLPQTGAAAEPPALQRERPRTGNKVSIASLLRFTKPSHLQQKQLTFGLVSQCVSHFFASSCAGDANADLPAGGPRVGAAGGPAREGQGALGAVSTPRVQHPHPGCPRALENRMAAFATLPAGAHQHQPQPSSSQRAMSPGSGAERHPHKSSPRRQEGEGEPAWPHIYSRDSCVSAGGGGHRMTQVEAWGPVLLEGQ